MPRPSTPRLSSVAATAPRRILIVEDDAGIRILLGSTLRLAGYDVRGAGNGPEALAEIERFGPDLVVMDVMLPGMDGWEVTRAMRANQPIRRVGCEQPQGLE